VTEMLKTVAGLDNVTNEMVATALTVLHPLLEGDNEVTLANAVGLRAQRYQRNTMDDARRMYIAKDKKPDAVVAARFDMEIVPSDWLRLLKRADKSDPRANWINDKVNAIIKSKYKTINYNKPLIILRTLIDNV
jgi:hypothetical protein